MFVFCSATWETGIMAAAELADLIAGGNPIIITKTSLGL